MPGTSTTTDGQLYRQAVRETRLVEDIRSLLGGSRKRSATTATATTAMATTATATTATPTTATLSTTATTATLISRQIEIMEEDARYKRAKMEEHYALLNRLAEEESAHKRNMLEIEHNKKMDCYETYLQELKVEVIWSFSYSFSITWTNRQSYL